jgi:hypothetical protein
MRPYDTHARLRSDVCARRWFWQWVLRALNLTIAFHVMRRWVVVGYPARDGWQTKMLQGSVGQRGSDYLLITSRWQKKSFKFNMITLIT